MLLRNELIIHDALFVHQKLTGGVMLSRNNDFMVFYRGKDFLSPELAEKLLERERWAKSLQDEEQARLNAASSFSSRTEAPVEPTVAGTLGETLEANSKYGNKLDENYENKMTRTVEAARHADLVRKLEWKLQLVSESLSSKAILLNLSVRFVGFHLLNSPVFIARLHFRSV